MPKILGIVNITPDSFSDGGKYLSPDKAIEQGKRLLAEGADILDLGPASSHPSAAPVSAAEELKRLQPVLAGLKATGAAISIDSFLPATQLYAIAQEVDYLNDVAGFKDASIYPQLAEAECKLIVMHSILATGDAAPKNIFTSVCDFFDKRLAALVKAGIAESRLIIDSGWGFFLGATPQPSMEMLARLGELKQKYHLPVLASVSRKSFLRALTAKPLEEIQAATLTAEILAIQQGADYIRTHEVAPVQDALAILAALKAQP